jgi:ribosomal protein S18 acetylase RimI-like enzyme
VTVTVRAVRLDDYGAWRPLYAGYAEFYGIEQTVDMADRVWGWLHDPDHELEGLVAVDADDRPIGLAHFRAFTRPLSATTGGFLDDVFVDPTHRGGGAVDALLARLRRIAAERGWSTVRWITAEDNYRARAAYDRVAVKGRWVTYDMEPESRPAQ